MRMARSVYQYEQPRCPDNWNEAERRFYNRLIETLDDIYSKYGRLDEKMLSKSVVQRIDNSTATTLDKMVVDILSAGKIAADSIEATFAHIVSLSAKYGDFDFETVKNLVADAMVLEKGQADYVHITNLAATYAQAVNATIGNLVIQSSDGGYYQLDVSADGKVSAERVELTDGEIAAGETGSGKVIVGTHITAETLGTATLAATQALVNMIDASRINVDTLVAREEFVQTLTANSAFIVSLMANEAFVELLRTSKIISDKSIEMIAGEATDAKNTANAAQNAANAASTAAGNAQYTANAAQNAASNAQASVDDLDRLSNIEVIEGTFAQTERRAGEAIHIHSCFGPGQDLKYGAPYPAGCGKNLLPNPVTDGSYGGVTLTRNPDGTINVYGNCTEEVVITIYGDPENPWNILGVDNCYVTIGQHFGTRVDRADGTQEWYSDDTVFLNPGDKLVWAYFHFHPGESWNHIVYPQIELGSAATEYAPYANTPAITGRTGLNAYGGGRNLISINAVKDDIISDFGDGFITVAANSPLAWRDIGEPVLLLAGQTYTFAFEGSRIIGRFGFRRTDETNDGADYDHVPTTGSGREAAAIHSSPYSFTPTETMFATPCFCSDWDNSGSHDSFTLSGIRLEAGKQSTPYESYQGVVHTLQFGETVYGGSVDWNAGEMTVDMGMNKLPLDWTWTIDALADGMTRASAGGGALGFQSTAYAYNNAKGACSHMRYIENWSDMSFAHIYVDSYTLVMIAPQSIVGDTSDSINAWLKAQDAAGTPVQVGCELAQPYTIQLTPVQLETIKGLNTVYTDADGGCIEFGHEPLDITDSAMPPLSPNPGKLWLDRSVTPNVLRRYNGSEWETVNDVALIEEVQDAILSKQAELEAAQRETALFLKLDSANKVVRIGQTGVTSEYRIDAFGSGVVVNNEIFSRFEASRVLFGNMEMRKPSVGGLAFDSIT